MARKPTVHELHQKVEELDDLLQDVSRKVVGLSAPIDVEKLRFTPRIVVSVALLCVSIAGGIYASTSGLRSDVRDILTTMEKQKELQDVKQRLDDKQAESLNKAIDAIDKRQQLQQIEIQELKEMVLEMRRRP